jgi:hypothetical protein
MTVAVEAGNPNWEQTVWLDPAEPYLHDHQPGSYPLLGTVGGLETIGWVADRARPGHVITSITDIALPGPIHFRDRAPIAALVSGRAASPEGSHSLWELATTTGSGRSAHVTCRIKQANGFGAAPPHIAPPEEPHAVIGGDAIYGAFFHGPAFRVIASAWKISDGFAARLASPLPDWSSDGRPLLTSPRLTEAALQTAGLLQLEADGAMRIPHAIARIRRWTIRDGGAGAPLFAVARQRREKAVPTFDIMVCDADGAVAVAVDGYVCIPLPFKADGTALDRLATSLSGTRPPQD